MDHGHPQSNELQVLTPDLERQGPPPTRKRAWLQDLFANSEGAGFDILPSSASTRTASSHWAVDVLIKLVSASNPRPPSPPRKSVQKVLNAFRYVVTTENLDSEILSSACHWYTEFLESKIRDNWAALFQPVLVDINPLATTPSENDILVAFELLTAVVLEFQRTDLALAGIVDELYNKNLLKWTDDERSDAFKLVFAAVGWISTLYCPVPVPGKNILRITDIEADPETGSGRPRPSQPQRSKTFTSFSQTLENMDLPLHTFFRGFGTMIPEHMGETLGPMGGQSNGWIYQTSVCFHTLYKIAKIRIEWVDCLSLHLEFNTRSKVLKLFRFPSLCFIMCRNGHKSALSQLFRDSASESGSALRLDTDDACEFFKEVLLSYRLIFGQNTNSYKDFNNMKGAWIRRWHKNEQSSKQADPMLMILCGQSCESEEARHIYDEIVVMEPSNRYSTTWDFPFLGKRLEELQDYVGGHNPHNFFALWYDRRDVSWWWTFWAVIIIGGATLVFALLQSVLQIMQVWLAQKQLEQGGGSGPTPN